MFLIPLLAALDPAAAYASGNGNFAGLADISGGRRMYLECRGAGSPTVVLISGKGNGAADWSKVLDPAVLVPHSYGGLVALLYARLHPKEVDSLVMVTPPAISSGRRPAPKNWRDGTRATGCPIPRFPKRSSFWMLSGGSTRLLPYPNVRPSY